MILEDRLKEAIEGQIEGKISKIEPLNNGCSFPSFAVTCNKERFFLKYSEQPTDAFLKEANGLTEITEAIHDFCPDVVTANNSFLLLDYITPERPTHLFWQGLASKLARLHRNRKPSYGFFEDNYIGPTPQKNKISEDNITWGDFFWNYRISPQLNMNSQKNQFTLSPKKIEALKEAITHQLSDFNTYPTLTHGDLWSGNIHCGEKQKAFVIDPAFYYGDREADIAMAECFGGFSDQFFDIYNEILPLDKGYDQRKHIYNLYHILNHYNLFGNTYKSVSEKLIEQIINFKK